MFTQPLAPIAGSLALSALLAALPLILLFVLLGVFKMKAWMAALIGLVASIIVAIVGWGMPTVMALSATAEGVFYGAFPIMWILLNAIWVYQLSVITGWFDTLGSLIRSVSNDQRILAILIAFCFGALMEALAGFGAPVAISAAMLMAAGMKPMKAAIVSLLANTAPVAFGAMGAPIIALAGAVSSTHPEITTQVLSQMAGRQTPFVAAIVPLVLVFLVDGWRGVKETWPVALVAGVVFGIAQFVTSNFITVEITDVVAALVTIAVVLVMLRFWKPKNSDPAGRVALHDADSAALKSGRLAHYAEVTATGGTPHLGRHRPVRDHHHHLLDQPDPGGQDLAAEHRSGQVPVAGAQRHRRGRQDGLDHPEQLRQAGVDDLHLRSPPRHRHAAAALGHHHLLRLQGEGRPTPSRPTSQRSSS